MATSGQAQEEAGRSQGEPAAQEEPAQALPPPLRVDVVEDEATAQARERSEAEARQREIDDLVAQQGMNEATRAMNEATQDMRDYAYVQTALVGIGTALLFVTLWLTWQANGAAQAGVAITEAAYKLDQRPWLSISDPVVNAVRVGSIHLGSSQGAMWLHFDVTIANTGKTPAHDARLLFTIGRRNNRTWDAEVEAMDANVPEPGITGFSIAPGETRFLELTESIPFWPEEVPPHESDLVWAHFVLGYQVTGDPARKVTKADFMLSRLTNETRNRFAPFLIVNAEGSEEQAAIELPRAGELAFTRWHAIMT